MSTTPSLTFPESPVIVDAFASPELRDAEASSWRLHRAPSYRNTPKPRVLAQPSADTILPILQAGPGSEGCEDTSARTRLILRHALQWALEHGDVELVIWLVGLTGRWAAILNDEVKVIEDDEGWGVVGMAIQASCSLQDKEEAVRAVVGRWGLEAGPRGGRDRTGWTPLHLAALISTPPLISFLLTRGASPSATTNRGLMPLDLIAGMPDRQDIAILLEQSGSQGSSSSALLPSQSSLTDGRQRLLRRRRDRTARIIAKAEEKEKRRRREEEREKWIRERVEVVGVDHVHLFGPTEIRSGSVSQDSGIDISGDSGPEESDTEQTPAQSNDLNSPDEVLVFSPASLPAILDIIITSYQPVRQPLPRRGLPANMLYLYARFAHRCCDDSWLEELLEGAVDRIEQGVYGHIEDLAYLAFWAYNTTLLLHLLVSDDNLRGACDELGLLGMVEELINAIHVFVIRVAERRIDMVLDGAILDYETLEDFDDVRFEGEWTLFRTFGTKKQRGSILPKASQVFSDAVSAATSTAENGSPSRIFGSLRNGKSPFKSPQLPQRKHSIQDLKRSDSLAMPPPDVSGASPIPKAPEESPSLVTDILTGVLVVLQLYDVNPVMTVQAFSQVFFWIAAELFNRILSRKKYLCRSKAVQIRMNITVLDDWVRLNGLPARTAGQHFEPVLQLLQWLQTQSNINSFDDLIGTVQGLKCLNPLQMRRAVKEYKFEVGEGRMDEECVAYMGQMQKDWENRRVQSSVKALRAEQTKSAEEAKDTGAAGTPIDALFDGSTNLADFIPATGPECFGELLDSRFMLPFQLPEDPAYLVAAPIKEAVYSNFFSSSPFLSDSKSANRSSFSSSRPFEYRIPPRKKLRQMPDDFFSWLKKQEAERRHAKTPKLSQLQPVLDPPLGPSTKVNIATSDPVAPKGIPHSPAVRSPLFGIQEDENTVPRASIRPASLASPKMESSFPSPGLRTSSSIDQLRQKAQVPFRPVPPSQHIRSESFELSIRKTTNSLHEKRVPAPSPKHQSLGAFHSTLSPPLRSPPMISNGSRPHYRLARESRENLKDPIGQRDAPRSPSGSSRTFSMTSPRSLTSSQSSDSGKKKWWKIGRKEGSGDSAGSGGRGGLWPTTPDGSRRSGFSDP